MARSREAPHSQPDAPAPPPTAWWALADALLQRAVTMRAGADLDTLTSAELAVDVAREQFRAGLEEPTPFAVLVHNAALRPDEAEVLALAAAVEADPWRQRVVAELHGDNVTTRVTLHLLGIVFPDGHVGVRAVANEAPLRTAALVDVLEDGPWATHAVVVQPAVMWALAGDSSPDPALPHGTELVEAADLPDVPLTEQARLVAVTGDDPIRRRQEAMRRTVGERFLVTAAPEDDAGWAAVVREATIVGAGVIVDVGDRAEALSPIGRRWIDRAAHLSWAITSRVELPIDSMPNRPWVDHHAPATEPTDHEWVSALGDVPRSHRLSASQLHQVARLRAADGEFDLDRAVRRLAGGRIDALARRIRPSRGWDDIVLSPDRMQLLHEMVARYRHSDAVYDRWGFTATPSRGQVALFSGPSGTGKTLAAEIVAGELGLDLFKLDLSAVVSKYIGETEKNLDQIFDAAKAGNVVLFFDEADSLFGKRSEVKDARDRYANIEVSYLLQRLEAYDGVVTLATNFEKNIDEAFLRRIHVRIEFAIPDEAERKTIWEHNLPTGAPVAADVDLGFLAQRFELSGGSIRNAALHAAFLAASGDGIIDMASLVGGVAREYMKLGRLIRPADFEPYEHALMR